MPTPWVAKISGAIRRLEQLSIFGSVSFECVGAKELQNLYRNAENSVEATFEFPNAVVLPNIAGVEQAYIGIVSAGEYLRLITDHADNIRRSLFYDNVRDFQDCNDVNRGIRQTIADPEQRARFAVLNNGITVVARELTTTRNSFTLRDYQVVNGCQTSHVLFDEREHVSDDLFVPLKIVVTQNEDVASKITAATNKQTQVSDDDLQALESFQKEIESYFVAHPVEQRLYYERRSKQYASSGSLEKTRIITRPQLVKAYAAMFLDEPWRAGRYYRELQKLRKKDIFRENDYPFAYYTAAVGLYRLEYFFRNQYIDGKYKPARYQILTAVRHLLKGSEAPPGTRRQLERYCDDIARALWDPAEGVRAVQEVLPAIDVAVRNAAGSSEPKLDRDTVRTQSFTDSVAREIETMRPPE